MIVQTLEDALDPNRSIDLYATWNNQTPTLGGTVTFIAALKGYDNLIYTVNWQTSPDNENWVDIPDVIGLRYDVTTSLDNYADYWRVQVVITGVAGEVEGV